MIKIIIINNKREEINLQDNKLYEMVKNKLYVGLIIKNYKLMCQLLNEKEKNGKGRNYQFKKWQQYFEWEKQGYKFVITEIYEEPILKPIKLSANRKEFKQFKVSLENEQKTGVYSITLNNDIYIGSTTNSFRMRFKQHRGKENQKQLLHTYNMINNGGTFQIIWIAEEGTEEAIIRQKEKEYIQYYKTLGDWNIINFKYMSNKIKLVSKYKYIKVGKKDYNTAIQLLQENGIHIKLNKEDN